MTNMQNRTISRLDTPDRRERCRDCDRRYDHTDLIVFETDDLSDGSMCSMCAIAMWMEANDVAA